MQHDGFNRNTRVQLKQVLEALGELMTPAEPAKRPMEVATPEDKKNEPAGKSTSKAAARKKA